MNKNEVDDLCRKVQTWDQAVLDRLIGQAAIDYARNHERLRIIEERLSAHVEAEALREREEFARLKAKFEGKETEL